jgi:hypothetical protein
VRVVCCLTLALCLWAASTRTASAQTNIGQRVSMEFAGAVNTTSEAADDPFLFLDLTATARITDTLDVVVRPWVRRLPGGDWSKEMYQLQVRYQPATPVPLRIDAGIITSPLGLITLEMRPDRNPLIGTPSYYFAPLPSFDGRFDRVQIMSGGYPLGAIASLSGRRWDARAGITDGTPARNRKMMSSSRPPARAQFVAGGGVTPLQGLRFGTSFARGIYREPSAATATAPARPDASATIFTIEGEYSIGYSRFAGEWIRDHFETATTPAIARGLLLEAVQTLTPRIYAALRTTNTSTPVFAAGTRTRRTGASAEATVGYRLSTDITLKGGYQGSRTYTAHQWDHAAAVSIVVFKRWW